MSDSRWTGYDINLHTAAAVSTVLIPAHRFFISSHSSLSLSPRPVQTVSSLLSAPLCHLTRCQEPFRDTATDASLPPLCSHIFQYLMVDTMLYFFSTRKAKQFGVFDGIESGGNPPSGTAGSSSTNERKGQSTLSSLRDSPWRKGSPQFTTCYSSSSIAAIIESDPREHIQATSLSSRVNYGGQNINRILKCDEGAGHHPEYLLEPSFARRYTLATATGASEG